MLQAAQDQKVGLFTSAPLLTELHEVLGRRKFQNKIAGSPFTREQLVMRYAVLAIPVVPGRIGRIVSDPKDDMVVSTAKAAKADAIVSGDDHLLRPRNYEEISILQAAAVVEQMRSGQDFIL